MEEKQIQMTDRLNELRQACEDSAQYYQLAGEHMNKSATKTTLFDIAHQRRQYRERIKKEMRVLGGDAEFPESSKESISREWRDVEFKNKEINPPAIIDKCIAGEELTIRAYEDIVKQELPDYIEKTLRNQLKEIKDCRETLQKLALQ